MRHHRHTTTTRVQHNWQYQIPVLQESNISLDAISRMNGAFTKSLPVTKRWAMSADFQANVNAALEREKNKP